MHKQPTNFSSPDIDKSGQCQPLWKYQQFANFLGIGVDAARHAMCAGKIPSHLYVRPFGGNTIRFIPEAVIKYYTNEKAAQ